VSPVKYKLDFYILHEYVSTRRFNLRQMSACYVTRTSPKPADGSRRCVGFRTGSVMALFPVSFKGKRNTVAFSPQANYTD
jgi:hypothetical protein